MLYIKPSVLVYQELQNAGGVANVTPDLGTVIIGPMYNVIRVDPLKPISLQSTLTKTITNITTQQVEIATVNYIEVPLFEPYPGQIVRSESIVPHVVSAKVSTISFNYTVSKGAPGDAFNLGSRSKYILVDGVGAENLVNPLPDVNPRQKMPDQIETHIEVGYVTEISYVDPDTTNTVVLTGTVTSIKLNTAGNLEYFTNSTPIPEFTAATATTARVRIYKVYEYFQLTNLGSSFNFADLNNDIFRLKVTSTGTGTTASKGINAFAAVTAVAAIPATAINPLIPAVDATTVTDYLMVAGKISVSYKALRQDKYSTILTINDSSERAGLLGEATEENPMGLAVQLALSNTTKQVFALSLKETSGALEWSIARELLENFKAGYAMVPLTQDVSELAAFKAHVQQMSTPEMASWRAVICNTVIPETKEIVGKKATAGNITTGYGKVAGSNKYLYDNTQTFVSRLVTPGDLLVVTASNLSGVVGTWVVDDVINEKTLAIQGFNALSIVDTTTMTYYIIRNLTRRQRAEEVAAASRVFASNRVWHVQPDIVGVKVGVIDNIDIVKFLPGYYLCAAVGGVVSGFPIQQGFTNISLAGIKDLSNSNFYFKREELDLMAQDGTCLYVQDTQQGIPYCRHALTTDMTVLEYREILKVKNWDFLSFFFYDKLKGFIGSWNITPDTLSNMRQVINASIELLKGQKLPRVGAPLLSGVIELLEQDAVNKDNVNIRIKLEIVSPNNYTNLYLVI